MAGFTGAVFCGDGIFHIGIRTVVTCKACQRVALVVQPALMFSCQGTAVAVSAPGGCGVMAYCGVKYVMYGRYIGGRPGFIMARDTTVSFLYGMIRRVCYREPVCMVFCRITGCAEMAAVTVIYGVRGVIRF